MILLEFLLLSFIIIGVLIHRTMFNLLSIFNIVWLLIICLYNLKLSYYMDQLAPNTVFILSFTFIAFFIGYIFVYTIFLPFYKKNIHNNNQLKKYNISNSFITKSFYIILIILTIETIYSKGFPIVWLITNPDKNYFDYGIPSLHGLLMSYLIFFVTVLYYVLRIEFNRKYFIYFMIICSIPLILISRQAMISIIIQILIVHNIFFRRINIFKLSIMIIVGIMAFGIIGNLRTGYNNFLEVAALRIGTVPNLLSGFIWAYMYLAMTLSNLNNLFTMNFTLTHGENMLEFFLPTVLTNKLFGNNGLEINFLSSINFNVSGYMANPYLDFGLFGLIIYTTFLGGLSCYIYHRYLFVRDTRGGLLYAIMLQIIMLSFFSDFLLYLPVSFQFVWVYLFIKSRHQITHA